MGSFFSKIFFSASIVCLGATFGLSVGWIFGCFITFFFPQAPYLTAIVQSIHGVGLMGGAITGLSFVINSIKRPTHH